MAMGSRSKADTGHAIQKAAQLDHLLLLLLLAHLSKPQMSNRRAKKILDTFGKRRRMARALGLIDEATNDDLTAIDQRRARSVRTRRNSSWLCERSSPKEGEEVPCMERGR